MSIMSDAQCAAYVEALRDGLGAMAARDRIGVTRSMVVAAERARPEFLAACEDAKSTRAAALLELAERETLAANTPAKASMAKSLASAAAHLAEKLAPKEYGAKLQFDGADGPAIIQIVSFARPAVPNGHEPIALEAHNVPTDNE